MANRAGRSCLAPTSFPYSSLSRCLQGNLVRLQKGSLSGNYWLEQLVRQRARPRLFSFWLICWFPSLCASPPCCPVCSCHSSSLLSLSLSSWVCAVHSCVQVCNGLVTLRPVSGTQCHREERGGSHDPGTAVCSARAESSPE